jgi:hypothetical protein
MKLPEFVPTPEEGLKLLERLLPHLQPAYDNSVFEANNYIETKKLKSDVNTLLTLVRLHVKNDLVKLGLEGIKFENLPLSGISFVENGGCFKSWKAASYELPRPGTGGRKHFLNQSSLLLPFPYDKVEKINNFVILWNLKQKNKVTLWLVCPKRYDEEERIVEAWWHIQIEDPASTMSGKTSIGNPPANDLEIGVAQKPKVAGKKE